MHDAAKGHAWVDIGAAWFVAKFIPSPCLISHRDRDHGAVINEYSKHLFDKNQSDHINERSYLHMAATWASSGPVEPSAELPRSHGVVVIRIMAFAKIMMIMIIIAMWLTYE